MKLSGASATSIAILHKNRTVFTLDSGETLTDRKTLDNNTYFQIGSTQKLLTALATLQQIEQGHFTKDQSLISLLPTID